jgi:hypothetical protein
MSCSVTAGLSGAGFAASGSALGYPLTGVSPQLFGSKASEYWIFCRFPLMSRQSYCRSQSFGPSSIVSGLAYPLLHLSVWSASISLADGMAYSALC